MNAALVRLFESRVQRTASGVCWEWRGSRLRTGYGRLKTKGGTFLAHRLSWEIHHGGIPDGMFVCHRCDHPPCVNPAHLFIGTQADNVADRDEKGRTARGERSGARLHPERWARGNRHYRVIDPSKGVRGERHGRAKLCAADVLVVLKSYDGNRGSLTRLAEQFGVSLSTISDIVHGKKWTHIPRNGVIFKPRKGASS